MLKKRDSIPKGKHPLVVGGGGHKVKLGDVNLRSKLWHLQQFMAFSMG